MDKPKQGQCLLKSVSGTHPHIEISANGDTFVGRSRETQIADTLVSKKHLKMRCDFDKKCVIVELLGLNPSTLNGKNLVKNNQSKAFNGDLIEIIPSKYPYKVHIEVDESMKSTKSTDDTTDRKRKRSIEEQRTSMNEPVFKKLKWTTKIVLDVKNKVAGSQWESYNNGQLLVYTPIDCKSSHKIAAYDMDGTLIATKSGKVWPKDADDWKLAFGTVATTLRAKHSDGYKIVILTNQGGISAGTTKITEIKKKIETIIKTLGVPIQAFVASGYDSFRKPLTGMWQALCDLKNDNIKIDMSHSFYVGDAAGRPENKIIKKKKDHSSVDRLMALNLELTFFTPEEHFLKASPQKWVQPEFNPKDYLSRDLKLINDPSVRIASTDLELILLVGGPGTGLHFKFNKSKESHIFEHNMFSFFFLEICICREESLLQRLFGE